MLCICVFQIQCLQQEKARLAKELEDVHRMHKEEMEVQQLQHYQVHTDSSLCYGQAVFVIVFCGLKGLRLPVLKLISL